MTTLENKRHYVASIRSPDRQETIDLIVIIGERAVAEKSVRRRALAAAEILGYGEHCEVIAVSPRF